MKTHCEKYPQLEKFNAFWERMALRYPLPFEEKTLADIHESSGANGA